MPAALGAALARLEAGVVRWVAVTPEGQVLSGEVWEATALLSGAFNPLHAGHKGLAAVAAERLARPVHFELPLVNADKAPLSGAEARRRAAQFAGWATVVFSRAPLFSQKAAIFPRSVFVIGADTAARLVEPRFYGHDEGEMRAALDALQGAGCRFLVAGRRSGEAFLSLASLRLPEAYRALFMALPERCFRLDISSSALRGEG